MRDEPLQRLGGEPVELVGIHHVPCVNRSHDPERYYLDQHHRYENAHQPIEPPPRSNTTARNAVHDLSFLPYRHQVIHLSAVDINSLKRRVRPALNEPTIQTINQKQAQKIA